jgi:hypothetical protein
VELFGTRLQETLASYLIVLLLLIPHFAFRVFGEALDEGRLVHPPVSFSWRGRAAPGRPCRWAGADLGGMVEA